MSRLHRNDARWKHARATVLTQAAGRCWVDGCWREATEADHIHPVSLGGDYYALDNLRASCRHHNASRGNGTRRKAAKPAGEAFLGAGLHPRRLSSLSLPEGAVRGTTRRRTHLDVTG